MTKNIGGGDRMVRFIAGTFLVLIGVAKSSLMVWFGLALLATAYLRTCPAYSVLNIDTTR
ncbi:DUF2892 domain-containing protein [Caldichromatium japonicum]|uniref:DUF2892 domain-containing protein n=1 Tax=Caldichromatium japonicum TaxID=2699430 RepID=A0A6G7VG83_9GAMM|nr:DUF2892 domain-containing protein [Caldichromatium japonicum]QIK38886.1 DUF2892 domain-containing protein [Caldichromatium japonicum]